MKKKYTTSCAASVGLLLVSTPAFAQDLNLPTRSTLLPTKNTRELNLSGSYVFNDDNPYALSGTYGLFTSPKLELGVTGAVSGARHSKTSTSVGAFADYYLRGNESVDSSRALLPYVGVFAGYSHRDASDASLGAQVGAKYFVNPNVALTGELQYRSTRHGSGITQFLLGISTFFH